MADTLVPDTPTPGAQAGTPSAGVGQGTEPGGAPTPGTGERLWAGQYKTPEEMERGTIEKQKLIERQAAELGMYRRGLIPGQAPAAQAESPKPLVRVGDRLFENVDGVLTEVVEVAVQEAVKRTSAEVERRNAQNAAVEQFFHAHPDINTKAGKRLAQVHAADVLREMPWATPEEAGEEIARRVRADLVEERRGRGTTPEPPHVGAGNGARQEQGSGKPAPLTPEQSRENFLKWRRGLNAPHSTGGIVPRGR